MLRQPKQFYSTPLNIVPASYVMRSERSGLGLAPFDPDHNSTALLVGEDLYAGTVADLSGVDPIIFRQGLMNECIILY